MLTFHRCINYGSYWQARCLVDGLRDMGHNAVLLDHRSHRIDFMEWRCALQPVRPGATPAPDRRLYARKTRKFFDAVAALPLSRSFALERTELAQSRHTPEMPQFDAVVVGSDEVWNLAHPWYGHSPIFFGDQLRANRLVAYAASCGHHPADRGLPPHWAAKLRRFDALSVRDRNTWSVVARCVGTRPAMVLDPCLQFASALPAPGSEGSGGGHGDGSSHNQARSIALYGHNFSGWFIERLVAHARRRGLRIVSIGYRNDWADVQWLTAGPEDFARFIANAGAVATNFFHGCVFALCHGKPFVCERSPYRAIKIDDLLGTLGARRHLADADTPAACWDGVLGEPVSACVHARIGASRASSQVFLHEALEPEADALREARHA